MHPVSPPPLLGGGGHVAASYCLHAANTHRSKDMCTCVHASIVFGSGEVIILIALVCHEG